MSTKSHHPTNYFFGPSSFWLVDFFLICLIRNSFFAMKSSERLTFHRLSTFISETYKDKSDLFLLLDFSTNKFGFIILTATS